MPRPYRTKLTPEQLSERARKANAARNANLTPTERSESASKAHLGMAVKAVVDRAPELTEAQRSRLAAIFAPGVAAPATDGRAA
mgnify:CR=1 FL=1